jgi:hypothetical protein
MADDIGSVKGINGTSMALNNQAGEGTQKPSATAGSANPGNTKPPKPAEKPVPMPK